MFNQILDNKFSMFEVYDNQIIIKGFVTKLSNCKKFHNLIKYIFSLIYNKYIIKIYNLYNIYII